MKRSILILAGVISLFMVSCKKDEATTNSTGGGKVTLENASNNAKNDVVDMINSEGAKSIEALSTLMSHDNVLNMRTATGKKKFEQVLKHKVARFKSIFIPISKLTNGARTASDTDRFVFADHIGTYTWNSTTQTWDVSHTGSIIVLIFPSDTNSSVNDCQLKITSYNDVEIVGDFGSEYYPTELHAELKINNVTQAKIDYTGSFNSSGVPTNISLTLFLNPFTYTINYSISGKIVNASASITKTGATLAAVSGTLEFEDVALETVKTLNGYVQYSDLKVNANLNIAGFDNAVGQGEATAADFNQYFLINLKNTNGASIGDVVFKDIEDPNMPGSTYVEAYIHFADGTEQLLSDYLQPIIDELENADFGV